jgi:hypothetical protein
MKIAVNSRKTIGWVALLIGFLFVVIPGLANAVEPAV